MPGHSLGPVSRCPEIARSVTSFPDLYFAVAAGGVDDGRERIDVGQVEPPRGERDERVLLRLRRLGDREVPHQRDPRRAGVEALRVRADHVPVDAAAASLVDRAEAVDEVVVADVVPAVSLHVVHLDPSHDRRGLRARVVVRSRRVVNDEQSHGRRERRLCTDDLLVGAPARARDDRRRAGLAQPPQRRAGDA